MTPEAARIAKTQIIIEDGDMLRRDGRPLTIQRRYASAYVEVMIRANLYIVPASCLAWYWHHGVWPTHAVRHRNGLTRDYNKENLRIAANNLSPAVRKTRRLTADEVGAYTGIRARGVSGRS